MSKLSENIKKYREKFELSQEEVANKCGVKRQTVSSWEIGRTEPNVGQLNGLANAFHCSLTDLIGDPTLEKVSISEMDKDLDFMKYARDLFSLPKAQRQEIYRYIEFVKNTYESEKNDTFTA